MCQKLSDHVDVVCEPLMLSDELLTKVDGELMGFGLRYGWPLEVALDIGNGLTKISQNVIVDCLFSCKLTVGR